MLVLLLGALLSGAAALTGTPLLRSATLLSATVRRAAASPVCVVDLDPTQMEVIAGAAAVLIGGGAIGLQAQQGKVVEQVETVPGAPAAAKPPPPPPPRAPPFKPQYRGKVTVGQHRMAGRFKKPKAREQWVPPPGWKKPKKPVTSWYDRGERLTPTPIAAPPPAPPAQSGPKLFEQFFSQFGIGAGAAAKGAAAKGATAVKQAYKGKITVGQHRMAGRAKRPPPRQQWVPPPGWKPPTKAAPAKAGVQSWYDAGKRL
jgi:hypothetical protein